MTKVKTPTSPDELAEVLADKAALKTLYDSPDTLSEFITGYAESYAASDKGDTEAQIREQVQVALAESLKASGAADGQAPPVSLSRSLKPAVDGVETSARAALYNKHAAGTKADGIFADAAEYFQATWHMASRARLRNKAGLAAKFSKLQDIQNSFGSEVPADGGFLIPEVLRSTILEWSLENSVVRPRATVIPMESLRVPIPMIDSTSNVSSVYGGVVAYWTEESASLTESQASFGRVVLDAKKLTAYANVPNELLADAPAFSGFFGSAFPKAVAYFEDIAFFTGTGAGEPLGFINCPSSVSVTAESGQAATTIVWENVVKMFARMLPTSVGNAVWVVSPDTFPQLATMALSVGTGGAPVWLSSGAQGPPMTILGRPVVISEKASALGTTGDICFVDFSYYLIGDRMQMQSMSSEHFKFANDQTSFRLIERVDGRPWLASAITPHNSGSTLSPFVQLATR